MVDAEKRSRKVIVLGAGVSGLTVSAVLQENGYRVEIWTDRPPADTTSCVAAAFWYPYLVQSKSSDVDRWASESLAKFLDLAKVDRSGVTLTKSTIVFPDERDRPMWMSQLEHATPVPSTSLPAGSKGGYSSVLPVIEMPLYLEYLQRLVTDSGATLVIKHVRSVAEAFESADIVINCTALGSRELFDDTRMYALRGQLVRFPIDDSQVDLFVDLDDNEKSPVYIVPRSRDVILGGTVERTESVLPDADVSEKIIERCKAVSPGLSLPESYDTIVGIRPCRHAIRLETERFGPGKNVVHNYGHGGGGVTMSWGCAYEVARHVQATV